MRETGRPLETVLRDPWAVTLLVFDQLEEMHYFEDVRLMGQRIDLASLNALGYREPHKLEHVQMRYERIAGLVPSAEDTIAKGLAMLSAEERTKVEEHLRKARAGNVVI
jgi:hypothetical protein